jgi:hypothetical protein
VFAFFKADASKDADKAFDDFDDQHEGEGDIDERKNEYNAIGNPSARAIAN